MEKLCTIIIGGGHAGGEVALALRQGGYAGRIVLISAESGLPYQRPPLSKAFLLTEMSPESLLIRPAANFEKTEIEFVGNTRVISIDRVKRSVTLSDDNQLAYDKLILATGSRPREIRLASPINTRPSNLHYLRTLEDAQRLKAQCAAGQRLVVIGGGYIGLEVASAAVGMGLQVTLVEAQPRVLSRVTAPELSAFYEQTHSEAGVEIHTNATICDYQLSTNGSRITRVDLQSGVQLEADLVLAGIGVNPEIELAEAAGLAVDNGIVVNEFCQTSDNAIYAIGDCSSHPSRFYQRSIRLESVPNAVEQARTAAQAINGTPKAYDSLPWFWSDQYDLKLQMVGLSQGYDQTVIRGTPNERSFAVFYFQDGRLIAADCVNRQAEFGFIRKLVQSGANGVVAERLADTSVPIKELL